jgi:uncharacterized circularly permuted ATP-grasp superfamily protein
VEAELLAGYPVGEFYDEMLAAVDQPRAEYRRLYSRLASLNRQELARRHDLAQRSFRSHGVTFTVYQDDAGVEKLFPFDLLHASSAAAPGRSWKPG